MPADQHVVALSALRTSIQTMALTTVPIRRGFHADGDVVFRDGRSAEAVAKAWRDDPTEIVRWSVEDRARLTWSYDRNMPKEAVEFIDRYDPWARVLLAPGPCKKQRTTGTKHVASASVGPRGRNRSSASCWAHRVHRTARESWHGPSTLTRALNTGLSSSSQGSLAVCVRVSHAPHAHRLSTCRRAAPRARPRAGVHARGASLPFGSTRHSRTRRREDGKVPRRSDRLRRP